jgi:hypothetical protein
VWLALVLPSAAQQDYVRLHGSDKLQTAIGHFHRPDGAKVDLVAVVHIADEDYYRRLNGHFSNYDSVLYEMVLDIPRSFAHQNDVRELLGKDKKEPKIDTTRGGRDPLSKVQKKLASILALAFQQDHLDYTRDNFRHADLTLEEFREAMAVEEKGADDLLKSVFERHGEKSLPGTETMSALSLVRIFTLGPTEKERVSLKRQSALMLTQAADPVVEIQGDVLIGQRNARAVEVLEQRLERGDRNIAVFYGAAHMPDLSLRLRKLGFKPTSRDWTTAWNLP